MEGAISDRLPGESLSNRVTEISWGSVSSRQSMEWSRKTAYLALAGSVAWGEAIKEKIRGEACSRAVAALWTAVVWIIFWLTRKMVLSRGLTTWSTFWDARSCCWVDKRWETNKDRGRKFCSSIGNHLAIAPSLSIHSSCIPIFPVHPNGTSSCIPITSVIVVCDDSQSNWVGKGWALGSDRPRFNFKFQHFQFYDLRSTMWPPWNGFIIHQL